MDSRIDLVCGGQGRDEQTIRMTNEHVSVKTWGKEPQRISVCLGAWAGGGGRTLLEVGCVKPTEGGN